MRILSVVGARPQFIKLVPVHRAIVDAGHDHFVVHTGQHYDRRMSYDIFEDLKAPWPDVNLDVRSASHSRQTGAMLLKLEPVLQHHRPDWVLTYGDTNSTLAAVITATQLGLRTAHIEAGVRSFNRAMPEEINRVIADHLSDRLFAPTRTAMLNLTLEGLSSRAVQVGDVMADLLLSRAEPPRPDWAPNGPYLVATIHRPSNTDDPVRLVAVADALAGLPLPVILPAHPRLRARRVDFGGNVQVMDPLPHTAMTAIITHSAGVITDSGGLQKEAYLLGVRCTTLRSETEWPETLPGGWNILLNDLADLPLAVARDTTARRSRRRFGTGDAATRIVEALC